VARLEEVPERTWEGAVEVEDEAGTVTMTMDVVVRTDVTRAAAKVLVVARVAGEGAVAFQELEVAVALAVIREEFDVATTAFWCQPGQLQWE